ncbi:MAG: hypothetical protein ACOYLS_01870 [Polymorphobacter sp.]
MPTGLKLLTAFAATGLLADAGYVWHRQSLLAALSGEAAAVLAAHGVTDGSVRWTDAAGWTFRTARLSGTADAATRAAVTADLAQRPGIVSVVWTPR